MSAVMNGQRHLDLDAALQEEEPLALTYKGKTYELPGTVSASIILKFVPRMQQGRILNEDIEPFMAALIGKDVLGQLLDDGLTFPKLEELLQWTLQQYGIVGEASPTEEVDSPNVG